jgi:hypothetical protein
MIPKAQRRSERPKTENRYEQTPDISTPYLRKKVEGLNQSTG